MSVERFSHIYIEEAAQEYEATREICRRYGDSEQIIIKHYKDVFNRNHQNLVLQKRYRKLILALKRPPFIYPGSHLIQDFGFEHYLYAPIMMNCLYDCDYCILQGMYQSGNVVFFVNMDDYLHEARNLCDGIPKHLSISYDTDLLAFEGIYPITRRWIESMRNCPEVMVEIRTKSANYRRIQDMAPSDNMILSWTLSPQCMIDRYEHHTASLEKRLDSVAQAMGDGWKMRLCFDPIIQIPGLDFERVYAEFFEMVFSRLDSAHVHDVALGLLRFSSNHLKAIKRKEIASDILYYPYSSHQGSLSYSEEERERILVYIKGILHRHIPEEKVFLV